MIAASGDFAGVAGQIGRRPCCPAGFGLFGFACPPGLCHPAEKFYEDYRGAARFGNLFSLNVGPDYAGRLREIDVQTLRKVGEMICR
ncbi:MAG TPA: hypothetical protein VLI39_13230 [Sedimentisphaerales bacterium]|nr:hypothetical protein [Sedimentisphaerales bacterium]